MPDQPYFDPTPYGTGPDSSVTDVTEAAAITHHTIEIGGKTIGYTATAGHLVTADPITAQPSSKFFYVAYTADVADAAARPVTFFYNGGPGSSTVFLLLGSFGPKRFKSNFPDPTPPPPYTLVDNPDCLLDHSDLVFVNPVGTGYSAAVAPKRNRDFWGVDEDAASIKEFIKRYLDANQRWNSPKYLLGESYGTARSCVLAWMLHEDGIELSGVTLLSSILDYKDTGNPVGILPTFAADAWYHKKVTVNPRPRDLRSFAEQVVTFAANDYTAALKAFPTPDPATVQTLSDYTGIAPAVLLSGWSLDVDVENSVGTSLFLLALLQSQGLALGAYDGRVTGIDTGIAASISPLAGSNDPTLTVINGIYTVLWHQYLNLELKFSSRAPFTDLNDQAFANWNFNHTDPQGLQKGGMDAQGNLLLYTAGDLAATMSLNPFLKVLSANGYFDAVTPFYQTRLDLQNMPLKDATIRQNLTIRYYPSGHMVYLDDASRTALKGDLAALYAETTMSHALRARARVRAKKCRPYFKRRDAQRARAAVRAEAAHPWAVPDLCRAYAWPNRNAPGRGVIALVELDGGWVQEDMEAFFNSIGQPMPQITDISVDGTLNTPNQHLGQQHDPDYEVALDIQVAAAAYFEATGEPARIRVYWAANEPGKIAAAVRAAAADGCDVCSNSWGADEAVWQEWQQELGTDFIQQMEAAAVAATNAGMIVLSSSGDNDSSDGGPNPANVDVPSSCPHVIGCGGTSKTETTETVWNNDPRNTSGEGTGGGFSTVFPPQAFQAGAPTGPGRMVPDVSANADPETGYRIFIHGNPDVSGGTSAVAPLYAGLFAACGAKLGFISPKLWANHLCFNDITEGDNGFYRALPGPDPCTGIGSPIGKKIAALLGAG